MYSSEDLELFSISEYTMKAFFPIVGEKEYKDSTLRTEQRQCGFTPPVLNPYLSHSCRSRSTTPCERPNTNKHPCDRLSMLKSKYFDHYF